MTASIRKAARIARRYSSPALAAVGGYCSAQVVRDAIHHSHAWPVFAVAAAVAWAASFAVLYVPYRAHRRELLRRRAVLLRLKGELDDIAAHGLLSCHHKDGACDR